MYYRFEINAIAGSILWLNASRLVFGRLMWVVSAVFSLKIPLLRPSLRNVVAKREPGLIVWEFNGFF